MFEKASRLKLRFETNRGILSAEDLWDLTLQHLNKIAKDYHRELKEAEETDFLNDRTTAKDKVTQLKFEIVKYILDTKKGEKEAKERLAEKQAEKEKLLAILERAENRELENLSKEELIKKINELSE